MSRWLTGMALAVLSTSLVGCAGAAEPPNQERVEVQVTLTEFKIASSLTQFSTGVPYRFVITNAGQIPHEFVVAPPTSEHSHAQAMVMVEAKDLPAGGTITRDYTFKKPAKEGEIEAACHVPAHYEAGMKIPLSVQ